VRKNIIIVLLIVAVAVSLSISYAEAISPTLRAFLEELENRVSNLESFNTYQIQSSPILIPSTEFATGTISCNNNDPIINASWESDGFKRDFRTWKITGDTLEYSVANFASPTITMTIFLTCKG